MRWRWLWFDRIPPELDVPKEARRAIRRRAWALRQERPNLHGALWTHLLIMALFELPLMAAVGTMSAGLVSPAHPAWDVAIRPVLALRVGGLPLSLYLGLLATHGMYTRLALCERGHLCCLNCSYDLRGQSHIRCPECGWDRSATEARPSS